MSGPGDRAPKDPCAREPTQSISGEGQGAAPKSLDEASALLPGSKEFGTFRKSPAREPGDLGVAAPMVGDEQPREDEKSQSVIEAENAEESDAVVVPKKPTKTRVTPVESVEGRAAAEGKIRYTKRASGTGRKRRAHVLAADRRASETETKGEVDQPAQPRSGAAAEGGVPTPAQGGGGRSG